MPIEKPNVEEHLKDNLISTKEATDLKDFLQNPSVIKKEKELFIAEIDKKYPDIIKWLDHTFSSFLKDSLDPIVDDKKNAPDLIAFENVFKYFKNKTGKESTFSGNGKVNDIFRTIDTNISEYKLNVLHKAFTKQLSSELSSYTNLEQSVTAAIEKTLQPILLKELKQYTAVDGDHSLLKSTYNAFISSNALPKLTPYQEKSDKVLAAVNRASLLSGFEESLTGDPKFTSHPDFQKILAIFETMLSGTSDRSINAMTKELSLNGHQDLAFESIFNAIKKTLKFKDTYPAKLNWFRVVNDGVWIKSNESVQRIEDPFTVRSLDVNQMKSSLDPVVSNPAITKIVITAPTDQKELVEYFYKNSPNKDKVVLNLVDGLKKLTVESTESKEIPQKISLKIPNLDSNMTATPQDITNLLIEESKKQTDGVKIKDVIADPDYKIVWGTVTGVASLDMNVWHRVNPDYDYSKNSNVKIYNQTELKADPNVIGNQNLALDRAGSFLKYFTGIQSKVGPDAQFNLNYKVDGPTKEALTSDPSFKQNFDLAKSKNPALTESSYLSELFKQRQNATLDLSLLKTETKQNTLTIPVNEKTHTKDYAFSVWLNSTFDSDVRETTGKIFGWIGTALSSLLPNFGNGHIKYTGCKVCRAK